MSLIVVLKFFHYIALFLAGGLGVANSLLAKAHQKAGVPPAPPVQKTMMTLARIGLIAIVTLWVTGIGLSHAIYGGFDLGWAFHMKLFGATILLLVISFLNYHLASSAKKGVPPHLTVMKIIPMRWRGSLILVLAGVAIVTTS